LTDSRVRHPRVGRGPEVWRTAVLPLHQCRVRRRHTWGVSVPGGTEEGEVVRPHDRVRLPPWRRPCCCPGSNRGRFAEDEECFPLHHSSVFDQVSEKCRQPESNRRPRLEGPRCLPLHHGGRLLGRFPLRKPSRFRATRRRDVCKDVVLG